jgi:23S rRNA (cytidine1920-2'-O)/16S rRNA (cytidine1409-2'-O)-methyltransferase
MNPETRTAAKLRLDDLLVRRGLFATRSRARDAVGRGAVSVAGAVITKAGHAVADDVAIEVSDPASAYVSRSALKLAAALDHFGIDPAGKTALDVGASTGGFTQVLLMRGAAHVFAIDVGHGQLHETIRTDPRVTSIEGLNARDLDGRHLERLRPDIVVADVSFISLRLAMPPALELARPGSMCVLLVKPQFEVGRDHIGKGGLLRDAADGKRAADDLREWLDAQRGWRATGLIDSPIKGGDGNAEFLLAGRKDR